MLQVRRALTNEWSRRGADFQPLRNVLDDVALLGDLPDRVAPELLCVTLLSLLHTR
jgi:hypothetical protein